MPNVGNASEIELAVKRKIGAPKGGPRLVGLKGSSSMIMIAQDEGSISMLRGRCSGLGYATDEESSFDDSWTMVSTV